MTPKQKRFVEEYLIDLNAAKAARRAGYSKKTAREIGYENLTKPHIQQAISNAKQVRSERIQIESDDVLQRLVAIDKMSIDEILRDDFSVRPLSEWPAVWRQTLSGIDVKEIIEPGGNGAPNLAILKKIKWPDKLRNLELMGKHVDVKAFTEQHRHTHGLSDDTVRTLKDIIKGARRKEVKH